MSQVTNNMWKIQKCDLGKGLSPHAKAIDIGDALVGTGGPRY